MALNDFKTDYILRYQDILSKVMVSKKIANTRFEPNMKFGDNIVRTILDISAVRVRTFTNLNDQTIDPLTDSEETMPINIQVGAVFPIARLEKIQAGPLNPAMTAGKEVAIKIANYLDAQVFGEISNAYAVFDTGNLTTAAATGTPITLSSTTVPQMVAQSRAKLFSNNVSMVGIVWVLDPFSLSQIAQFPIGKDITSENNMFQNGWSGNLYGAEVFESNNLTGEATLVYTGSTVAGEALTIAGITFTNQTTIGSTAGNFLASDSDSTTGIVSLAGLLNAPGTTSANQVALTAANQIIITDILGITAVATSATVLTIVGTGSSRLTLTEDQANATWATNFVHCYYGMKDAIDLAVQDQPVMEMRDEAKQLTTNIFNNVVAALKTFTDGSQKFLDVHIKNA